MSIGQAISKARKRHPVQSALNVRVAGAAFYGLFHVNAVGFISIVQIAVSGGSGNVLESVVTEYAVGRRGRAVGPRCGGLVCKWNPKGLYTVKKKKLFSIS